MNDQHNKHGRPPVDQRVIDAAREGCPDAQLKMSRRAMLGVSATLFSSAFLPGDAFAATDPEARLLVVVLRGGVDGMGVIIPKLDPRYAASRGAIAIPFASTLSLGADFALHPALARLHAMYTAGDAAFVPAAGIPLRNRSHFECQDNLENGLPANTANATGWLNRLLGALPTGDPIRTKRGIEIGEAPLILRGPEPVLGWSPTWFEKVRPENFARLQTVYTARDPNLWYALNRGVYADRLALASGAGNDPNLSVLRKSFIGAARLIRAAAGPRIAVISVGDWDTHSDEGGVTGMLNDRLLAFDEALGDFKTEVGALWPKTVVVCVTEFGRTVLVNGNRGTDHGIGSAALLLGGAVKQGIVGDWPGLAPAQLLDGDLRPTVDLRGVFKGLLRDHLGVAPAVLEATVFPGSAAAPPIANLVDVPAPASSPQLAPSTTREPDITPIGIYRRQYGAS